MKPRDHAPKGVVTRVCGPASARTPLKGVIALIRGGTCTFASVLLTKCISGIITLEGAPQSHLGVVSREFQVTCVMQFTPTDPEILAIKDKDYEAYLEAITVMIEGKKVKFDLGGEEKEGFIKASVYEVWWFRYGKT